MSETKRKIILSQTHGRQMATSLALLKSHHMDDHLPHAADWSQALVAVGLGDGQMPKACFFCDGELEHIHSQTIADLIHFI